MPPPHGSPRTRQEQHAADAHLLVVCCLAELLGSLLPVLVMLSVQALWSRPLAVHLDVRVLALSVGLLVGGAVGVLGSMLLSAWYGLDGV